MKLVPEYATYREIKSQTEAWAQALDVVNASASKKDLVVVTSLG